MNSSQALLSKAKVTLKEARVLVEAGLAAGAADRCYYAMFYAASALLKQLGLEFSSHHAVLAAFGKELARTGKVDARYHRMLLQAFELCQKADYDYEAKVGMEPVRAAFEKATDFVSMAQKLSRRKPR